MQENIVNYICIFEVENYSNTFHGIAPLIKDQGAIGTGVVDRNGFPQGVFHANYAKDMPILTIDSTIIYQTHAEGLRCIALKMHPGPWVIPLCINMSIKAN
jgi:hypothetical protein